MSEPKVFRQESGIAVDPEIGTGYYLIRSIAVNNDTTTGEMIIDTFLMELFKGINMDLQFEYFGHPSTIVCDDASVVMASQIYDRAFSITKKKYVNIKTVSEYFTKRNKLYDLTRGPKRQITWLGKPSVIFSYTNRNRLRQYLNGNTVINLFFWITSFNSSGCIYNFSKEPTQGSYCDKYKNLKKFCNISQYQAHDTFLSYKERKDGTSQGTRPGDHKFITDFIEAIARITQEDNAIDEYNSTNTSKKQMYQRYNEVFTYFFPWDITGIEIGLTSTEELNKLLSRLHSSRTETIENIEKMLSHENLITTLNIIISLILCSRIENIHAYVTDSLDGNFTYYLIAKLLLLSLCDIEKEKSYVLNKKSTDTIIIPLLTEIMEILREPISLYEYQRQKDTNKFKMILVEKYNGIETTYVRQSDFILFEQDQLSGDVADADQFLDKEHEENGVNVKGKLLTVVVESTQQLSIDASVAAAIVGVAGKKTRRTLVRPRLRTSKRL